MKVVINLKPSHRVVDRFKSNFPNATFYGSTNMGKKGKSYLLPLADYEQNKAIIKEFGTKAKDQPFL